MMRDVASGKSYHHSGNKKIEKHECRIGGTLYATESASKLTDRINRAMAPDENGKINPEGTLLRAIIEARVRIDLSDSERKDLISYSSDQERGNERLALDIALIKAEKALSKKDREILEKTKEWRKGQIIADIDAKDKKFKKYRAAVAMKKAGITLGLGTAIFFGSQEIMASIDPNKIGVLEKLGVIGNENAKDAKETLLASGFGALRGGYEVPGVPKTVRVKNISNPDVVKIYEDGGWTKTNVREAYSEFKPTLKPVHPSESTARINVKYDGWASNGTKIADGNEIRGQLVNGKFISNLKGASTFNGRTINYDPSTVKGYITVGDSKFEIAGKLNESGQLTWGENGVFTTTTGETIKAVGDNGEKLYKYFEIAVDNGVDGNGVQHIIPLATDVGANTFSGTINQLVEETIDQPAIYDFVKTISGGPETLIRGISTNGFAFAPELARTGLGEAVARPRSPRRSTSPNRSTPPAQPTSPTQASPESVLEDNAGAIADVPVEAEASSEAAPEEVTLVSPVDLPPVAEPTTEPSPREQLDAVPEENIETMPDAPEVTVPPETSEENSEFTAWENEIKSNIEEDAKYIGKDGVAAMLDTSLFGDEEAQKRWRTWWSGLSDGGKNIARELVDRILSSDHKNNLKWGNGFRTWLEMQK